VKRALAGLAALALALAAAPALAQTLSFDLGEEGGSLTGRVIQLVVLFTVLSLAPSILVVLTSFTRIIVVLSLMRSALGIQQTPPNAVLISLALFLTAFVMAPTLEAAYTGGIVPLIEEEIGEEEAFARTVAPFRTFMLDQVREKDLVLFVGLAAGGNAPGLASANAAEPEAAPAIEAPEDVPLKALVPAFMISELRRAFEIAFLIFIPFLIIDMVVASVLMSMGMMMLPPVIISLPFKLIFFVLLDGWYLIAGSLVQSFGG
jgi:flagellar biosynthetic protein FliP